MLIAFKANNQVLNKPLWNLVTTSWLRANVKRLEAQGNDQLKIEVKRLEAKLRANVHVQPTLDNHSNMVNKLELGATTTRLASQCEEKPLHHKRQQKARKVLKHIQWLKCSDMGHYAFMCSSQVESKTRHSRRQRKICASAYLLWCALSFSRYCVYPSLNIPESILHISVN
jgi:hypothetical protein